MNYMAWGITLLLLVLFFWLYKKKKVSGRKATILFFVAKGTISSIVILYGMFSFFGSEDTGSDISALIDPRSLSIPSAQKRTVKMLEDGIPSHTIPHQQEKNSFESLSSSDKSLYEDDEDGNNLESVTSETEDD